MKEWYFINVTNVVTDHLKSQILNFDKHMQERVHNYMPKMPKSPTNATTVVSQHPWGLTCGFT